MTTNAELIRRAQRIVAERRQKAMTLARQADEARHAALPALTELENRQREAGIRAAKLAVRGAPREQIDAALAEARSCTAQRNALLEQAGHAADAEPAFTCPHCRDTGRLPDGRLCECVRALVREMRREAVNASSPLELSSFESFSLERYPNTYVEELGCTMRQHMARLRDYARDWADNFTLKNPSLYMCGYAGLGKTHLALAIARTVLDKGYNVVYVSAQNAFDAVEKERFGREGDTLGSMMDAELLILDDLGTEFITPYVSSCLYSLINTRVCRSLPTIYTSNIVTDRDLQRRYTEKIVSRLLGSCETMFFCGEDIRLSGKGAAADA